MMVRGSIYKYAKTVFGQKTPYKAVLLCFPPFSSISFLFSALLIFLLCSLLLLLLLLLLSFLLLFTIWLDWRPKIFSLPSMLCVWEALQLCCWPKPKNRKEWIPHQNSKEQFVWYSRRCFGLVSDLSCVFGNFSVCPYFFRKKCLFLGGKFCAPRKRKMRPQKKLCPHYTIGTIMKVWVPQISHLE